MEPKRRKKGKKGRKEKGEKKGQGGGAVAQTDYSHVASDSADKGTSRLPYIVLAENPTTTNKRTNSTPSIPVIHQTLQGMESTQTSSAAKNTRNTTIQHIIDRSSADGTRRR